MVVILPYDQMTTMDENVNWMKLPHLMSDFSYKPKGPLLYISLYFETLIAFLDVHTWEFDTSPLCILCTLMPQIITLLKKNKNSSLWRTPKWIECLFIEPPWPHPRATVLDGKLLHLLQGVNTILVTNSQLTSSMWPLLVRFIQYHGIVWWGKVYMVVIFLFI